MYKAPAKQQQNILILWDCSSYEKHQKYITSYSAGYICWVDLYNIYEKDKELKSNLRKNPKLLSKLKKLKQLEITFQIEEILPDFLEMSNTWSTISNSNQRFSPNILRNAVINGDKKLNF